VNRSEKNENKKLGDFAGPKQSSARRLRGRKLGQTDSPPWRRSWRRAELPKRDREGGRRNGRGERLGCGTGEEERGAGNVGAGGRACGSAEPREREEAVGGRKEMTGGPGLSAGERG